MITPKETALYESLAESVSSFLRGYKKDNKPAGYAVNAKITCNGDFLPVRISRRDSLVFILWLHSKTLNADCRRWFLEYQDSINKDDALTLRKSLLPEGIRILRDQGITKAKTLEVRVGCRENSYSDESPVLPSNPSYQAPANKPAKRKKEVIRTDKQFKAKLEEYAEMTPEQLVFELQEAYQKPIDFAQLRKDNSALARAIWNRGLIGRFHQEGHLIKKQ